MSETAQRRVARNEDLFRETNEAIRRGLWPGEPHGLVRFRCECARLDCSEVVELSVEAYERVRADPRRFVVRTGHELPDVEEVVDRGDGYVVVTKLGAAGDEAVAADPHS
jgi:hypothetical protein